MDVHIHLTAQQLLSVDLGTVQEILVFKEHPPVFHLLFLFLETIELNVISSIVLIVLVRALLIDPLIVLGDLVPAQRFPAIL
jgi:hypothetical protein